MSSIKEFTALALISRLGLGTAAFGSDYGISNKDGQVLSFEARRILKEGLDLGLKYLDTAPAYGSAELALGEFRYLRDYRVITKTLPGLKGEDLIPTLYTSLEKLGYQPSVYGLLVHDTKDLSPTLVKEMLIARDTGLVKKLGVSVYSPIELMHVLKIFTPDIVQLPMNVFDQRFDSMLYAISEIHVRSVFLQGVVFLEELPPHLTPMKEAHDRLKETAEALGITTRRAALEYIKQKPWVTTAIVGVTSVKHLAEIAKDWLAPELSIDFSRFRVGDERLINPSLWGR